MKSVFFAAENQSLAVKYNSSYLGHPKPSKTLFLVPKNPSFGGENHCFAWFWVLQVTIKTSAFQLFNES